MVSHGAYDKSNIDMTNKEEAAYINVFKALACLFFQLRF